MNPTKTLTTILLAACATLAMAEEQPKTRTVEVPDVVANLVDRIHLHGYAQAGYTYNHSGGDDTNTFDIKRVLFWANADITDRWSFLFMHDFSSVVQEFYTDFRVTQGKALTIRFGQFKNGLSYENPLSPTAMETIDVYSESVTFLTGCGSDPLMGVQYGRDLGLALFGTVGRLRYELEIMNGQGINRKDGNADKDFIARIEWRATDALLLVATGQKGRGHAVAQSLYNPEVSEGQNYRRDRLSAGFDFKQGKLKAHGEYLLGKDHHATSQGAYLTGSFSATEKCDIVASYDFFNFNTDLDMDQHKAVVGLQYWFYQKCRVQAQYVYKSAYTADGAFHHGANHAIMCQMQIRFN